jgi:RNA polymerase sigma-70 factor (ECF subfamily)
VVFVRFRLILLGEHVPRFLEKEGGGYEKRWDVSCSIETDRINYGHDSRLCQGYGHKTKSLGIILNPTDQELVKRSIEGDESAFNELINRYKRGVYTLIIRMVRNSETANDLSQDAFIKLYSSLSSYNPEYKFSSWLFKIANNLTIDYLRKQKGYVLSLDQPLETEKDTMQFQVSAGGEDPLDRIEALELGEKIKEAIEKLPPDYRRVILLRHVEDMSYEEIVEVTDLPLGTVKTLIFRGRRQLRKHLQIIKDEG